MKSFFLLMFCCIFFLGDRALADMQIVNVSPKQAAELIAGEYSLVVIDVRTQEEFDEGHIVGAKVIDVTADDFEQKLAKLDKKKSYLVHCRSGGRSGRAMEIFKELGFEKIYHLNKGMLAWEEAGLPVSKE
jgi:rhodanese-related sulfurtransferase